MNLSWSPATGVDQIAGLAERCHAADGGLAMVVSADFLARRWSGDAHTTVATAPDGTVVAAGSLRPAPAGSPGPAPVGPLQAAPDGSLSAPVGSLGLALDGSLSAPVGSLGLALDGSLQADPDDSLQLGSTGSLGPAPAGSLRVGSGGWIHTGLVDPAWRGRGLGTHLLDFTLNSLAGSRRAGLAQGEADGGRPVGVLRGADGQQFGLAQDESAGGFSQLSPIASVATASGGGPLLTVEAESLTPDAAALFASFGLQQVFAEDVLGIDLGSPPARVPLPAGVQFLTWSAETAPRFHAVYEAAFRERPGFPGIPAAEWIDDLVSDDDFRPECTLLAVVDGVGDAGFITCLTGWIDQVGVTPSARAHGLGAALVGEALHRLHEDGSKEAVLCVNVDNRAAGLYRRLGFTDRGRRARFTPAGPE